MQSMSHSKIKSWKYCPAQFYRQYILQLEPYNPKFEFGTNYHKMVEMYHKRLDRDYERNHRTGEIIRDAAGRPVREYIFDPESVKFYTDIFPPDWFDATEQTPLELLDALEIEPGPVVEKRYSLRLEHPFTGKVLPVPMTMIIDGIRVNELSATDHKTSITAYSQNLVDNDPQATMYLYGLWQMTGMLWKFNFVVARKSPGPRTKPLQDPITTTRTVEQFAALHEDLSAAIEEILTARSYPCYCEGKPHMIKGITE
jgi:hypothetical protein